MATKAISASRVFSEPFGISNGDLDALVVRLRFSRFMIGEELDALLGKGLSSGCETSVSSIGRMLGSISTTVTFVPNALKM